MNRSPLTDRYDRLDTIVNQILGLNEEERGYVLDRVDPKPEAEEAPKQKKTRKKRSAPATTEPRKKKGLPEQIVHPGPAPKGNDEEGPFCGICHHNEGYQDHFALSPNYHEFEAPKKVAA